MEHKNTNIKEQDSFLDVGEVEFYTRVNHLLCVIHLAKNIKEAFFQTIGFARVITRINSLDPTVGTSESCTT